MLIRGSWPGEGSCPAGRSWHGEKTAAAGCSWPGGESLLGEHSWRTGGSLQEDESLLGIDSGPAERFWPEEESSLGGSSCPGRGSWPGDRSLLGEGSLASGPFPSSPGISFFSSASDPSNIQHTPAGTRGLLAAAPASPPARLSAWLLPQAGRRAGGRDCGSSRRPCQAAAFPRQSSFVSAELFMDLPKFPRGAIPGPARCRHSREKLNFFLPSNRKLCNFPTHFHPSRSPGYLKEESATPSFSWQGAQRLLG